MNCIVVAWRGCNRESGCLGLLQTEYTDHKHPCVPTLLAPRQLYIHFSERCYVFVEPAAMSHLKHRTSLIPILPSAAFRQFLSSHSLYLGNVSTSESHDYFSHVMKVSLLFQMNALAFCFVRLNTVLWPSCIVYSAFSWSVLDSL